MKKLNGIFNKIFQEKQEIAYLFLVFLLALYGFSFYRFFNPKPDNVYKEKVVSEIKAININFDKKTIERLNIPSSNEIKIEGNNAFRTY